jgi:hypothetical protein
MQALDSLEPEIKQMYRVLGQEAVSIALRSGKITPRKAQEITKLFATGETVH